MQMGSLDRLAFHIKKKKFIFFCFCFRVFHFNHKKIRFFNNNVNYYLKYGRNNQKLKNIKKNYNNELHKYLNETEEAKETNSL